MGTYPRAELDEMLERWVAANLESEKNSDWRPMAAEFYTDDIVYCWNLGPDTQVTLRGKQEITDILFSGEMGVFGGWTYPYQKVVIDDVQGEVVCFWKQVSDKKRPDGTSYEVAGVGGSWLRYAGNYKWDWQRDFLDWGNMVALFTEMATDGVLEGGIDQLVAEALSGEKKPGYFTPISSSPVGLWEFRDD